MDNTPVYLYTQDGQSYTSYESITQAALENHCSRSTVRERLDTGIMYNGYYWSKHFKEGVKPVEKTVFLTEKELRQRHDVFYKIKSELDQIPKGQFIEESSLFKKLSIWGKPGTRSNISQPEIQPYKGKADNTVYYGHPESIEKLKNEGVLS